MRRVRNKVKALQRMRAVRRRNARLRPRRQRWVKWRNLNSNEPVGDRVIRGARDLRSFVAPKSMDFSDHAEETVLFIESLRSYLRAGNSAVIDLRPVQNLSPECAIALMSVINRPIAHRRKRTNYMFAPRTPGTNLMLTKIGFYDFFPIFHQRFAALNYSGVTFAHYDTGVTVDPNPVARIAELFAAMMEWSQRQRSSLYKSFIECLTNVLGHAYPKRMLNVEPWNKNRWWLMGHQNPDTHEIWFCAYDCGVGIPDTIRVRVRDMLLGPSDEELIIQAVTEGRFSRTKIQTRGKGLPTLLAFVAEAKAGELRIASGRSVCTFTDVGQPAKRRLKQSLSGTLIVWTLRKRSE